MERKPILWGGEGGRKEGRKNERRKEGRKGVRKREKGVVAEGRRGRIGCKGRR